MSEIKPFQIQVVVQFVRENEDGDIEHIYAPVAWNVTPAQWKAGWDWQTAFAEQIHKLLSDPPAPVD